jgi:MFS family permease
MLRVTRLRQLTTHAAGSSGPLRTLGKDERLLFMARFVRLFAYGALSVVLVFYLTAIGLTEAQTGLLLTLTLVGDTLISLFLTTRADRFGRRRMLVCGSLLMIGAGVAFAITGNFFLLLIAGTIGVISPSGNEVGPFLPVEQAALSQVAPSRSRTGLFAWYQLAGSLATALGSLAGGIIPQVVQRSAAAAVPGYRAVIVLYASVGVLLAVLFSRLSPETEVAERAAGVPVEKSFWGLDRSRNIVLKLSTLFALDSFAGGFVVQSFVAYWFYLRFAVEPAVLGSIFFGANLLAGASSLLASRLASRFGLVNTMVFTHLPSNVLLILVPLMPTLSLAILVLLLRFAISQIDVPTRQSYMMAVVPPEERSAAAGITSVTRTIGASAAPIFVGMMFTQRELVNLPFFIAGTLKIVYDLLLYRGFRAIRPPDDTQ